MVKNEKSIHDHLIPFNYEESSEYRARAIEAGVRGYVAKHKIAAELVPVLRKLMQTTSLKNRGERE